MSSGLADNHSKKSSPNQSYESKPEIFTYKSQHMDYFDAQGVTLNTGYTNKLDWYLLPIRELLDNACDFLQKYYRGSRDATITVNIHLTNELFHLAVRNSNKDDKPVFTNLKPIFDFEKRYGSKQDVHIISRGMLGDALKQVLSLGYTLLHAQEEGSDFSDKQWSHPLIIRHNGRETSVYLEVDKARQEARAIPKITSDKLNHIDTELELKLPVINEVRNNLTRDYIEKYCRRYTLLTTDISFIFTIIDDITHTLGDDNVQDDINIEEELDKALSTPPERAKLKIEVQALHAIISEWKNTDSIHSYKPEEFKNRILHVSDKSISVYDILSKFREGSNISKTQYEITVQELLIKPDDERNKIIEQYFIELHKVMPPPELSLPYQTRFKIAKEISQKRKDVLIQRIRKIRDNVDIGKKISYKLVKGTVTDDPYLKYPFAFEILAIPLKNPLERPDNSGTVMSDCVKQHEFIGMVNYSFSPKNNFFVGEYHSVYGWEIGHDISGVLSHYGFRNTGSNYHKLPCIIVGNLITPKWEPISKDKSGVNMKPFAEVVVSAIERISKEIETYHNANITWERVGSKNESVDIRTGGDRGPVSAKGLLIDFLREQGRL